jgi:hypothetical protein
MIATLIAGLSILLFTGLANSYISYRLFVEHPNQSRKKSS